MAVQWFQKRGHNKITVFVPQWRKESSKPDSPIIDQEILLQLERDGLINFTPSRRIREKKIVCYDDRFIVRLAAETGGVIVSNDNFRDLVDEDLTWREAIEKRLLMFTFADDLFMPPTDPLGRSGPHLDVFLRFDGGAKVPSRDSAGERIVSQDRQPCPYAERCTFGPKCRFYHPEREQRMREREAAERSAKSVSPPSPSPSPFKCRGESADAPSDLDLSGRIGQLSLHQSPTKVPARVLGHPNLTKANSGSSIHDRDYQYQNITSSSRSMDSIPRERLMINVVLSIIIIPYMYLANTLCTIHYMLYCYSISGITLSQAGNDALGILTSQLFSLVQHLTPPSAFVVIEFLRRQLI